MALSRADLATIRSFVGSAPADDELVARYDRLGSPAAVALEVLRERLADVVANPLQWSADGDYSENRTGNIGPLQALIDAVAAVVAEETGEPVAGALAVSQLTRPDPR